MWRLYFMVFAGDERSEEAKHAHESPWSMTGPLIVLAIVTTLVGWLGLPHLSWFETHESVGHVVHTLADLARAERHPDLA